MIKYTLLILCMITLFTTTTHAHPIVTAIAYDPSGSDGGHEWVELFNPTNQTISLQNYSIERGNGANENDWTTVWSNTTQLLEPYSFYLLGEVDVVQADELVKLTLQNGPDALRLNYQNTTLEVIGWGEHEFSEYYHVKPAVDVANQPIVRNFSIRGNEVFFSNESNHIDFYGDDDYQPRTQYFSYSQLLLPTNAVDDISYVFEIPNYEPVVHSLQLKLVDISQASGYQIVVPEAGILPFLLNVSDENGLADIVTVEYELGYGGEQFFSGTLTAENLSQQNSTLLIQVPFTTEYPSGTYTVVLRAIDSQGASSKDIGFVFTIDAVIGVSVGDDVLVFILNETTGAFHTRVSIKNTGNLGATLDLVLFGDDFESVTYAIDDEFLLESSFTLRAGESQAVDITLFPKTTLQAGRYTGLFRVMAREAHTE